MAVYFFINISDDKSENIGDKFKKSVAYIYKNPGLLYMNTPFFTL